MQFKEGCGWKACYDEKRNLYTAETGGVGCYNLYEITRETYELLNEGGVSDFDSVRLIHTGRHLYMDVNDRCGPPYTVVLDDEYRDLCPWANIICSGRVWGEELTDAAVELFESEAQNRPRRRRKRQERKKMKGNH